MNYAQHAQFLEIGAANLAVYNEDYHKGLACLKSGTCKYWKTEPLLRKLTNNTGLNLYQVNLFDCPQFPFSDIVSLDCHKVSV